MKRFLSTIFFLLLLPAAGCYYSVHSTSGNQISSAQIQEIRLGQTTEMDLLRILGQPTKKDVNPLGLQTFLYAHTEVKSITLPGGFVMYGLLDRERDEIFEVVLKDGIVQSYHFIKE